MKTTTKALAVAVVMSMGVMAVPDTSDAWWGPGYGYGYPGYGYGYPGYWGGYPGYGYGYPGYGYGYPGYWGGWNNWPGGGWNPMNWFW